MKWDYEVMPLTIRISANHEWLSDAYYDANVIPDRVNFGWFLQGFNSVESLVEFVPIEDRISVPAYRGRGKPRLSRIITDMRLTCCDRPHRSLEDQPFRSALQISTIRRGHRRTSHQSVARYQFRDRKVDDFQEVARLEELGANNARHTAVLV